MKRRRTYSLPRVNPWFLARPRCLLTEHLWEAYGVIHPAWNQEGEFCRRCLKQNMARFEYFTIDGVTRAVRVNEVKGDPVRTAWNIDLIARATYRGIELRPVSDV